MLPKISVITISFNSKKTIEKTIKSVIEQNYPNLEYIIIDGGSTDGTLEIINKYKENISYFVSEADKGISDAFNKGIKVATGEIIGIINSDDEYLPNALNTVAKNYEKGIDVYIGSILINDEENKINYTYKPSIKINKYLIKLNIAHPSTFVSKSAYENYGLFSLDFKIAMDLDLLRRFYYKGAKFKQVEGVLAKFNVGGVSTTVNMGANYKEREMIILRNGGNKLDILVYRFLRILIDIRKKFIVKVLKKDYIKSRYD